MAFTGIGSGLGGFLAVAAETTYGTWAGIEPNTWPTTGAGTLFPEVMSSKIGRRQHAVQGTGLAKGRIIDPSSRFVNIYWDGGGATQFQFPTSQMSLILNAIFGTTASMTALGTSTAYELGGSSGIAIASPEQAASLSICQAVPDAATGAIHPFTAVGAMVTDAEFTCERSGLLEATVTWDAMDVLDDSMTTFPGAPTAPSFPLGQIPFSGNGMSLKVGPVGSEITVDGVKKLDMKIARKLATDRVYLGQVSKLQPVTNGITEITGSFDIDFGTVANKHAFADAFSQFTEFSVIMDWQAGPIGTSGQNNELTLSTPAVHLTGATPELAGPGIVTGTFPFKALIPSTGLPAISCAWISADTK